MWYFAGMAAGLILSVLGNRRNNKRCQHLGSTVVFGFAVLYYGEKYGDGSSLSWLSVLGWLILAGCAVVGVIFWLKHNNAKKEEETEAESDREEASEKSESVPQNNKRKIILIVIALLVLLLAGIGGYWFYDSYTDSQKVIRAIIEEERVDTEQPEEDILNQFREEKDALLFKLVLKSEISEIPQRDAYDRTYEDGRLGRLAELTKVLELQEYCDPDIKEALFEATEQVVRAMLEQKNGLITAAYRLSPLRDLTYYNGAEAYLDKETLLQFVAVERNRIMMNEDVQVFVDYLERVEQLANSLSFVKTAELLPTEQVHTYLTKYAQKAVFQDGIGGFYDDKKALFVSQTVSDSNDAAVTHSYVFYGDFLAYTCSVHATEEEGEQAQDTQEKTLYFRGEEYAYELTWFDEFVVGKTPEECTVYVYEKGIIVVSDAYIVTNEPQMKLPYT